MKLQYLRKEYHARICREIIRFKKIGFFEYPNFADRGTKTSRRIATLVTQSLECEPQYTRISGQSTGSYFEIITKDFLESSLTFLQHLRPGKWHYATQISISDFDQYEHLADLEKLVDQIDTLSASLGTDYIIKPDIIIGRYPISDDEINQQDQFIGEQSRDIASLTPLREVNIPARTMILHASISCKWTLRSDRSQNARAEALNLIRNRKGGLPHVVAVTAEPMPTRIASLALGTGDLDCVYHFALPELRRAIQKLKYEDQMDMLNTLITGRRLRDISDLPFDLII
ncbi:MAG: NgoMIV family type II restriction endonuclease [Anaerolineales bacterium]